MEESICSRIRELISYYNISDRQFAIKIGVTQSVIGSMFQKQTEPSAKILKLILSSDERISAEWLLRGKGEMLLTSEQPTTAEDRLNKLIDTITFQQDTIKNYKNLITDLKNKNKLLEAELTIFKNNKLIG